MRSPEEEIFVSMVVVRRPMRSGRPDLDPAQWAQSLLNGLNAEGAESQLCSVVRKSHRTRQQWGSPMDRLCPNGNPLRGARQGTSLCHTDAIRWVWLGLGVVCCVGSVYSFYLLAK